MAAGRAKAPGNGHDLDTERANLARAQTELTEIKIAVARKDYEDLVSRMVFAMIRPARDRFLVMPSKLAHTLAAEREPGKVMQLLTAEIHQILDDVSKLEFPRAEFEAGEPARGEAT